MRPSQGPPRLALWLVQRRVSDHDREFLVGDLLEGWEAQVVAHGRAAADRWFWRESLAASFRWSRDLEGVAVSRGAMTDLSLDLRLAFRRLRRAPGFALSASLTIALGVGAACAIAAVARPALWGDLPFREADRILTMRERFADGSLGRFGYLTIRDLDERLTSLDAVAAVKSTSWTLSAPTGPIRLTAMGVSASFLDVMGVGVARGRDFAVEEDRPNAPRSVILTDQLWRRQFAGDTAVIGRSIRLDGIEHQVVGILPSSWESVLVPGIELLHPLRYADTLGWACRDCRHLHAVGRVRRGVPVATARLEAEAVFARLRAEHPKAYAQNGLVATTLRDYLSEGTRGALLALLGAAGLLLVIALVNATNLFLARGIRQAGEVAVRAALGASQWRVARAMVVEALLVATLGALFGLAIANATVGVLVAMAPAALPRIDQVQVGWPLGGMAVALAMAMGLVSGLVPASVVRATARRVSIAGAARGVVRGGHDRVRRALVVVEMAVALLLLGGAGILVRSVQRLLAVDVGFRTERTLTASMTLGGARYDSMPAVHQAWRAIHDGVRAIPGVEAASLTSQLPMSSDFDSWGMHWEHAPRENPAEDHDAFRFAVTPDYAATMGLTLVRGRFLAETDHAGSEKVIVINETLAQREFGDRDPIGARVKMGGMDGPWRTVVGVVSDVQHLGLDASRSGQLYLPLDQNSYADSYVRMVVRASIDPASLVTQLRAAVRAVDPDLPLADVSSYASLVEESARQRKFARALFQAFALAALVLAAVGTFGVVSGMVAERTREIGLRAALGATRTRILAHFLAQGGRLAAMGIAVGVAGALAFGRALEPLVFGVSARDPATLLAVGCGLGAVALIATLLPAWRASRLDAVDALRADGA